MNIDAAAWSLVRERKLGLRFTDEGWVLDLPEGVDPARYRAASESAPSDDPVVLIMLASSVFGWRLSDHR